MSLGIAALATLIAAGLVIQVFLVGLALFVDTTMWRAHRILGRTFEPLALIAIVLALAGRQPAAVRWRAVALFILLIAQGAMAANRGMAGAVHPVNAILIFWVTVTLAIQARAVRAGSA